jgi:hypothetical protein
VRVSRFHPDIFRHRKLNRPPTSLRASLSLAAANRFWLNEGQWAATMPLLPQVHTGPARVDDCEIISGVLDPLLLVITYSETLWSGYQHDFFK